jgi:Cupin-like domain
LFEDAACVDVAVELRVEEFAERYVRRERPVIVRGGAKEWPPSYKWTPEYLKAMYGARSVKIGVSKNGGYLNDAERLNIGVEREAPFAKTIDDIFAPTHPEQKCRIDQKPLKAWGALDEESPPIPYVLGKVADKHIWMATTGSLTKTHYDMEDNINVQVRGRKEIILFPSAQLDELYPRSAWDYMSNFSRVEIETPDLSRYPRFSRATPLRAILEPGDFIYIPIYWWHQFYTLEASLNVNFWWRATCGQALRRHGLRYWPRMARDLDLHTYIVRTVRHSIESFVAGLKKN